MLGITAYLEAIAEVAELQGQLARLVRLFGAAASLRATLGILPFTTEQVEYERLLATARAQLGQGAFDTAWAEGQTMTRSKRSPIPLR